MRKNTTNENIGKLVSLFEKARYFHKTIRNILSESWYKLLVPHNTTTFFKDEKRRKSCTHQSTCCTLSPPTPRLNALNGLKNLFQTLL